MSSDMALKADRADPEGESEPKSVRAVSRAIAILQAINRLGSANLMTLSRAARVPYPTAARLVETLIHEGLIEREQGRKHYRPTVMVQTLSSGFQEHDRLVSGVRAPMDALTRQLLWPLSFVTRVGNAMVVRASTHDQTSLTFNNYHPGFSLPILGCASGLVYLAYAEAKDRQTILRGLKLTGELDPQTALMFENDYLPQKIRRDGYALVTCNPNTLNPGKTSSIALPLFDRGTLAGALTFIFFARAMRPQEAVARYLSPLKDGAAAIEAHWTTVS